MTNVVDHLALPWLTFLAAWSLRWGILIALLAIGLTARPSRKVSIRHGLCLATLAAGILLPLAPRWGNLRLPWLEPTPQAMIPPVEARSNPSLGSTVGITPKDLLATNLSSAANGRVAMFQPPQPPSQPLGAWKLLALSLTLVWATVVFFLSVRWLGGTLLVAKLRRSALAVDESSAQLLGECRAVLDVTRQVNLAMHPAVVSPVTLGGGCPLILVSPDWETWPESHRRACLLHELAHVRNRDDWTKLVQEWVRIPLFFHPLVRWLCVRLDRERELLSDEAAVALGIDPIAYARLLVDLARRPGRLLPEVISRRPGWLPFLEQRTLAVRIERLLEDDMSTTLSPRRGLPVFVLGSLVLAAALGIGGLGIRTVASDARGRETTSEPPARKTTAEAPAPSPSTALLKGRVLDHEGTPVADAVVVAGFLETNTANHKVFRTDQDGRFAWPVPPRPGSLFVIAHKEGLAPATWISGYVPKMADERPELRLPRAAPFSGKLLDLEGQPLAGAKVRVTLMAWGSVARQDGSMTSLSVAFFPLPPDVIRGSPLQPIFEATTDQGGEFSLAETPADYGFQFRVTAPGHGEMRIRAETPRQTPLAEHFAEQGFVSSPPDETIRLVAFPSAKIVGRVTSKLPDIKVGGLDISPRGSRIPGKYIPNKNAVPDHGRTADDGRFVIDGLYDGMVNLSVNGPGFGELWTYRAPTNLVLTAGRTSEVTIELIPNIRVEGKVVDRDTGAPIEGVPIGVHDRSHPSTSAAVRSVKSDAQGRFRIGVPPGETHFYVMGTGSRFNALPNNLSSATVNIPENVTKFDDVTIKVVSAIPLHGRVVDAQGKPVPRAILVGVCQGNGFEFPEGITPAGVANDRGEFQLAGQNHSAPPGHNVSLLVRLANKQEFRVPVTPKTDGEVTVQLPLEGEALPRP